MIIIPKRQQGYIVPIGFNNAPSGTVTVSGETVTSSGSAGIRVNTDGTIDSRKGSGPTYAQIDASTDWIIPNSASGIKTYHVRLDINESNMHASSDSMNTWLEINTAREWWHVSSGLTRNGTLRVSDDGGSTDLDTGTYSLVVP